MGVVKRQGIKQTIVAYVGMALGMMNALIIYPGTMLPEELGIVSFVRETAVMFSLFAFLGSADVIVRYFPIFKDETKNNHGFLALLMMILGTGCILLMLLFSFFKPEIIEYYGEKSNLYIYYVPFIIPVAILVAFANLFTQYASNFHRIVVPSLFNELLPKIILPIAALLYFYDFIPFYLIVWSIVLIYSLTFLGQIGYLVYLGQFSIFPDFSFLKKPFIKDIAVFCTYGFIGGLGSRFSSEFVSIFMVGTLSTPANTGVFTIALLISSFIDVPRKAISKITSPILTAKWREGKTEEIQELYQKTSLNQLIVGLWILLAIWVAVDSIFKIMPNGELYMDGKWVILILGAARVVDMMTGVNSEILSFSKYYRYNFFLVLFMAAVHIGANILLIPKYHLIGAALATLISLFLYNLLKFLVLKWRLDMQPFTKETFWVLVVGGVSFLIVGLVPDLDVPILDAVIKPSILTIIFGWLIWFFKLSHDFNSLLNQTVLKMKKYLKI